MTRALQIRLPVLAVCRIKSNNWFMILLVFTVVLLVIYLYFMADKLQVLIYSEQVPVTTYYMKENPGTFNAGNIIPNSSRALLQIYEQQLCQYTAGPFLPTYQNHRLILKFNISSIATYIYGNVDSFQGSNRRLRITCLEKSGNDTTFERSFDFILRFNVQKINAEAIHFTFDPTTVVVSPLFMFTESANKRTSQITQIIIRIDRVFSINSVFTFMYQWLDSDVLNFFHWPQWPLTKLCANRILQDLVLNHTVNPQRHFSCSVTSILTHSTSRQLLSNERMAISHWLDIQHKVMITDSISTGYFSEDLLSTTTRTRRRTPFEVALDSEVCSTEFQSWISKYQDWHDNISDSISDPRLSLEEQRDRIVDQNIRFMLYEKNPSGTADRIVHLVTTYLIAILTNRLFLFDTDWPEFSHVMLTSLNYERETVIPWFPTLDGLNRRLYANNTKYLTSGHYKFSHDRFNKNYDYDRQFPERILTFRAHTGGIVQMMTSQESIYRKFLTEDLGMRPENMFGCLYHSLFVHRLTSLIEVTSAKTSVVSSQHTELGHFPQQILQILLSPFFYPIGVQVRTGDATMRQDNTRHWFGSPPSEESILYSYEYFLTCAHDLVNGNQTFINDTKQMPIIFLLSDTVRLRRAALLHWKRASPYLQSFGNEVRNQTHLLPVVANSSPVLHIFFTSQRLLALHLAMFDIFLFGLCEQHVITIESGFGTVGVFASLKQRNIYSLSTTRKESCLGRNRETSLVSSSYQWSGI